MHLRASRPSCSFVRRSSSTVDNLLKSSSIAPNDEFVNAFVCKDDNALHSKALREGSRPLRGKLIGVKDNICTSKWPTTCSSRMLESFVPPFDATVVSLLEQAGGIVVGKTNCDEFGMGSLNTHTIHGPVINPYKPSTSRGEERSAGGSSGGSAAAVSAGMCHIALGTDTGGSIRLPASYCGVVGFKPSYGIVSRWGVISYADSLDCVGVMAREVDKVQEAFDILNVHDERDPTSVSTELRRAARKIGRESSGDWWETALKTGNGNERLKGLRVGVPQEYFPREITPSITHAIRNILRTLQQNGATIVPVSLPSTKYALSAYYVLASAEASSNLARYDGIRYGRRAELPANTDRKQTSKVYAYSRSEGFGSEVKKRILLGTYALKADAYDNYFLQAQKVRQLVRNDFNRVFKYPNLNLSKDDKLSESKDGDIDVLIHPSAIRTAPLLSTLSNRDSPRGVSMTGSLDSYVQDVLTVPASLAGLPALSVPMSMPEPDLSSRPGEVEEDVGDGWPVGVSIVGQWGCDEVVLRVGKVVQDLAI